MSRGKPDWIGMGLPAVTQSMITVCTLRLLPYSENRRSEFSDIQRSLCRVYPTMCYSHDKSHIDYWLQRAVQEAKALQDTYDKILKDQTNAILNNHQGSLDYKAVNNDR